MLVEAATKDMWVLTMQPKHFLLFEQAVDHEEYQEHVKALRKWIRALFDSEFDLGAATRRINPFVTFDDLPELTQESHKNLRDKLRSWYGNRK